MRNAKGLIVRTPWIHLILSGQKTWEMRSRHTKNTGSIYLIEAGTGLIKGRCLLSGTHKVTPDMFDSTQPYHQLSDKSLLDKWNIAWRLCCARYLEKPIPYIHPRGAVTWVNLPEPFYE
ncbi:hypothetical protein EYS14_03615 [Alteromonadaceae bacterium M269]|nr:hypothetical protein EYS14_03615 [Alteromonadaceae bacterium M269]